MSLAAVAWQWLLGVLFVALQGGLGRCDFFDAHGQWLSSSNRTPARTHSFNRSGRPTRSTVVTRYEWVYFRYPIAVEGVVDMTIHMKRSPDEAIRWFVAAYERFPEPGDIGAGVTVRRL